MFVSRRMISVDGDLDLAGKFRVKDRKDDCSFRGRVKGGDLITVELKSLSEGCVGSLEKIFATFFKGSDLLH